MKRCTECGLEYDDRKRYCKRCGAKLVSARGRRAATVDPVLRGTVEALEARLEEDPLNPAILVQLANAYGEHGLTEDELVHVQKALTLAPDDADLRRRAARLKVATGRAVEAVADLEALVKADPDDTEALHELAGLYEKTGHKDKALEASEWLLRQCPEDENAARRAGRLRALLGKTTAAIEAYEQARQIAPKEARVRSELGVLYQEAGKLSEAAAEYRATLELDPHQTAIRKRLGEVLYELGDWQAAVEVLEQLKPLEGFWRGLLAIARYRSGDLEGAFTGASQLREDDLAARTRPPLAEVFIAWGDQCDQAGRHNEAEQAYLRAACTGDPAAVALRLAAINARRGETAAKEKRLSEALKWYRAALKLAPDIAPLRAEAEGIAARLAQARKSRGKAIAAALAVGALAGAVLLGWRYTARTHYLTRRAIARGEAGLKAAPSDQGAKARLARLHGELGLAYREEGRTDEATAHLRRAADLGVRDARVWHCLGTLSIASGKYAQARQELAQALKADSGMKGEVEAALALIPQVVFAEYFADRGSVGLCVVDADGWNQQQLTGAPQVEEAPPHYGDPVWSPDGRRIACLTDIRGNLDIEAMDADGGNPRLLTTTDAFESELVWLAGSREIGFLRPAEETGAQLCVLDPEGGSERVVSRGSYMGSPAWSPDGQKVAVVGAAGPENSCVSIINVTSGSETQVVVREGWFNQVRWSPDGKQIVLVCPSSSGGQNVGRLDFTGPDARASLTELTSDDHSYYPNWSPDGGRIAFTSARDGDAEICVIDSSGANQRQLTNNTAEDYCPLWSPDGQRILFLSDRDGAEHIWLMDADGANQVRLTHNTFAEQGPAWKPIPGIPLHQAAPSRK